MSLPNPSPDELVSMLSKTSVPTVLVEGTSDVMVYRWFEMWLSTWKVDLLHTGGRENLLEVYRRRAEFEDKSVLFMADSDTWVFTGVPIEFKEIVLTKGYSIENDILDHNVLQRLFDAGEKSMYFKLLKTTVRWFTSEVEIMESGGDPHFDCKINQFMSAENFDLCENYSNLRGYVDSVDGALFDQFFSNYKQLVRGKNILDIYVNILNQKTRVSKFPRKSILELSVKINDAHSNRDNLVSRLAGRLVKGHHGSLTD